MIKYIIIPFLCKNTISFYYMYNNNFSKFTSLEKVFPLCAIAGEKKPQGSKEIADHISNLQYPPFPSHFPTNKNK
jgi:hypothetical protein